MPSGDGALINITEVLHERYQDSPKEDGERLKKCWGYNDCGDCHRSEGFCGWCAISQTCLPLPTDPLSRAFPLLSPIRYKFICALGPERFELRTSGLGCQVSTITFLTSIVTIGCTLFGVLVLYGLFRVSTWVKLGLSARRGGYVIYDDGSEEVWVRKGEGWGAWWKRVRGEQKEFEVEEVHEGTSKRGWIWWGSGKGRNVGVRGAERRPLLAQ
ncbi:uncharacterized protein K460DRAFT_276371 [Cucurbitaria berberidis CBS 394.84]|uniref:PSI domain-containing protein n=1 Tax=Cucurbitaria berberidis CBS 394.84 TaxID=1168544 RepID=A0A9P4GK33_9PLEO|nr:uncharacterized protein K460DRAFT_276371 [Cucurbitaria berberidis CBS 394.84]KAF1847743.1 hypothetical protein K460DRAFT_276371 [Cucurbitaria berberidis CBS 394.84]